MFRNKKYVVTNMIFALTFILLIAIDRITKNIAVHNLKGNEIELIPGVFSLH